MSTVETDASAEIGVVQVGTCLHVELRRPAALNALNLPMVQAMLAALDTAQDDPEIAIVLITGAGERAFCAGGDIRAIYDSLTTGKDVAGPFWRTEYDFLLRIEAFAKPVVVLMDAIVMGGGVGLAMHASHRLVTERTRLAMPEVGIGFIPDVGATWRLPQAPNRIGDWLALTGEPVGPADAILAGLADAMVASTELASFRRELAALPADASHALVDRLVSSFAVTPEPGRLLPHTSLIAAAFDAPTLDDVLEKLKAAGDEFAEATAAAIVPKSPMSLHVTRRLLQVGSQSSSLSDCLDREFRTAVRITRHPDFAEGIRAAVVDKDRKPRWRPWTKTDAEEWDEFLGMPDDLTSGNGKGAPQ